MNQHYIEITNQAIERKADLIDLLQDQFGSEATVVAESSDQVISSRLEDFSLPKILDRVDVFGSIDGRPAHASFDRADGDRLEGRIIRETSAGGLECHRVQRRLMCFGEVTHATSTHATSSEARVSEFTVPVTGAALGDHLVAICQDYLAIDDDGQAGCVASIVTSFEALKAEVDR